ncbi:hypothetical protein L6Q96_05150 [Candidatus Binatia bacterium]|nr:hypothetical protein [Candidatus Binatia bacterium]
MGALLLTAFTFEAYLNHLGEHLLSLWSYPERRGVEKKYDVLCDALGIAPDFSRRPYQTLGQLLRFRDALAHGRSEILEETKMISVRDDPERHSPRTRCEECCTLQNARLAKIGVEALITGMHERAGLGDHPFKSGMTESHISVSEQGVRSHKARKPDRR